MDGFKNTTRMRTFTSSTEVARTAGRTVGRVQSFAQGGHAVPQVDPNHAKSQSHGHGLIQREEPTTEELDEAGGRSPLKSGYAKGGKPGKHFHVHHHYHSGGKTNTKSKHYGAAEKAAEREVEGAGPMMATGGTRDRLKKGGMHIKPENKGKFTKKMTGSKHGKLTGRDVSRGLHSKSAETRKEANFARMARRHFEPLHHADGGHIHDDTSIPAGYPDYATGGTIDRMNAGGAAYGGMATGGTANPLATGGMPMRPQIPGGPAGGAALAGPTAALAARRAAMVGRPLPGAIGARPLMRAGGGKVSATEARSIARGEVGRHVGKPAPMGHKGLAKMVDKC